MKELDKLKEMKKKLQRTGISRTEEENLSQLLITKQNIRA